MQTNNPDSKNKRNSNKSFDCINQQKISDIEIYQTYEKLKEWKNLLDNFFRKNLFPKELYTNINYSLKFSLDLLEFYRHKVLVCGTINSGKTSFINTILRENILDFSSFENSKWPIIIRNKNKENQYIINQNSNSDKKRNKASESKIDFSLYSSKLIKSKYLFELEKKTLLAQGKNEIKSFLKNLNNNGNLENIFKEFQFNFYEKQIKLTQFSEISHISFCEASIDELKNPGNNNESLIENHHKNLNESGFYRNETKQKRKNILEKSMEEINKSLEKIENIQIIHLDDNPETNREELNIKKKKDVKAQEKEKSENNKNKISANKIQIQLEKLNSYDSETKKLLIKREFIENFILQNESFVKFLQENNLYDKLFNKENNDIDEKEIIENLENYKKFKKNQQKNKKITTDNINIAVDSNIAFSPFLFNEKLENFIFILEIDFEELCKDKIPINFLFNDRNSENFEIWDIPGLNSDKNLISDLVINNIIKSEQNINNNFNFINDKRLILLYLSECNNFNQIQNKNIWEKLSLLREFTSENFFVLNKIDLFSTEDFKKNNLKNLSNIKKNITDVSHKNGKCQSSSKKKDSINASQDQHKKNFSVNDDEDLNFDLGSDSESEEALIYSYLKNLVRNEFHLSNNSICNYTDRTMNFVNLKTAHLNSCENLHTNSSFTKNYIHLNTTGNLDCYGTNKHKTYFFQSENTSVFLISSLYSFMENCEFYMNFNEDYWELKKNIFETNAILMKEFKNFKNFRRCLESKISKNKNILGAKIAEDTKSEYYDITNSHEEENLDIQEMVYLPKFHELILELRFSINKKNFFSKICSNFREFINCIVYESRTCFKNLDFDLSPKNNMENEHQSWEYNSNLQTNSPNYLRYNSECLLTKNNQNFENYNREVNNFLCKSYNKKRNSDDLKPKSTVELENYYSELSKKDTINYRNRAFSGDFNSVSINKDMDFKYLRSITKNNKNSFLSSSEIVLSYTKNIFEFYLINLENYIRELTATNKENILSSLKEFKKELELFIDDIVIFRESKILAAGEMYKTHINNIIKIKNEFNKKLDKIKLNFRSKVFAELEKLNKNNNLPNQNDIFNNNLNYKSKIYLKTTIIEYFTRKIIFDNLYEKIEKIENQFNFKISKIIFDITLGLSTGLINGILAFCGTNLIQTILNSKLVFFSSAAFCFTIGIGCLVFFSFKELKNIHSTNKQLFLEQNEKMMKFLERYVEESNNYLDEVSKKMKKICKTSIIKISGFIDFLKNVLN